MGISSFASQEKTQEDETRALLISHLQGRTAKEKNNGRGYRDSPSPECAIATRTGSLILVR